MYRMPNLNNIYRSQSGYRRRISSYDRSGGNDDRMYIEAGESVTIADIQGTGMISHIWMTHMNKGFLPEVNSLRKILLEFYWDEESTPSVAAPLGDFFGMGHAQTRNFVSAPLQMSPEDGKSLNCWFPMPFRKRAKVRVINECNTQLILYFYIDYQEMDELPVDTLYFHARWNRECPTDRNTSERFKTHRDFCFSGKNTSGVGNYMVLEANGFGHYVGCNVNIHNLNTSNLWDWPGEGDDMIFIDGEKWPPGIHGTGTEDYVNLAWCPTQEYNAPYHGLILGGKDNWKGKISYYRYHIADPVNFRKSIKVTIEHGHNNNRSDDWSSTAYWYQTEPHMDYPKIPPVDRRMPVDEEKLLWEGVID